MINLKNLIDFLPFEFKEQDTYNDPQMSVMSLIQNMS